ncbi:MAG: DUF4282 domain-containing protein [Sulfuricurvum sp.]|nr:DUF4282 domain-containing protein [Sulfuricurvum sp.]
MDFLTFESFISIKVLIVLYYAGALFIPIIFWYKRQFISKIIDVLIHSAPIRATRLILGSIIFFILLELGWRMMFEMLIGFFQMRDYLQQLVG